MKIVSKIVEILLKIEEKNIMREVSKDERVKDAQVPDEVRDAIFDEIRRIEEKKELEKRALEMISSENKELIRLGKIYKKSLYRRKYVILAAILVLAMSMSITSFGGVDRMFHKISSMICGRTRETVDTEGVKQLAEKEEEVVFAEIEEKLGFHLVRLRYRPAGTQLIEANYLEDVLEVNAVYGTDNKVKIIYEAVPNCRNNSKAKDIEDEFVEKIEINSNGLQILIKEYQVDNKEQRWLMQFEYRAVSYFIYVMDSDENEVCEIAERLYFPKEE